MFTRPALLWASFATVAWHSWFNVVIPGGITFSETDLSSAGTSLGAAVDWLVRARRDAKISLGPVQGGCTYMSAAGF